MKQKDQCIVSSCPNNVSIKISLFSFPKDATRSRIWMKRIMRRDLLNQTSEYIWANCRICSDHFDVNCFTTYKRNRLKADAIPNILSTQYYEDKTVTIYHEKQDGDESDSDDEDNIPLGRLDIPRRDDLTTVCRGCMSSSKKHLTILLEDTTMQMFNQCTRLNASYGDGLPNAICDACLNSCRLWSDFYAQCQHSDIQLRTDYGVKIPEKLMHRKCHVRDPVESVKVEEDVEPGMMMDSFVCNSCDVTIYGDEYLTHVCGGTGSNVTQLAECKNNHVEQLKEMDSSCNSDLGEIDKYQVDFSDESCDDEDDNDMEDDEDYDSKKESGNDSKIGNINVNDSENEECSTSDDDYEEFDEDHDNGDVDKSKVKVNNCQKCPLRFVRPKDFKHHMKFHKLVPVIKCQKCGETFDINRSLTAHCKKMHPGETIANFMCTECNKACLSYSLLRMHLNSHDNVGIMCTQCGIMLSTRAALNAHNARFHTTHGRIFKCAECHKIFNTISELKSHRKSVHTERAFSCTFCPKSFKTPSTLRIHILTHLDKKHCDKCKRGFRSDEILARHIDKCTGPAKKKHFQLRPRIDCGICKVTLDGGRELEAHLIEVHSNEVSDIRKEIDKHKTKACLECGKRFFYYSNLRTHKIQTHGKVDFICDHCGKSFRSSTSLISHTARKHPEKVPAPQALLDRCKELESANISW